MRGCLSDWLKTILLPLLVAFRLELSSPVAMLDQLIGGRCISEGTDIRLSKLNLLGFGQTAVGRMSRRRML